MSGETTTTTAGGQVDVKALVAEAVTAAMAGVTTAIGKALEPVVLNQKVLADTLASERPAARGDKAKGGDGDAAPLTADTIKGLVSTTVADALRAHSTGVQAEQARKTFQADKLKDLPEIYRDKLGADPAQWAVEEQQIRETFKRDVAALGLKVEDVGGNRAGAGAGKAADVDAGKALDPVDELEAAVKATAAKPNRGLTASEVEGATA